MGGSWAILFSLLPVSFLSFIVFPLTLRQFFLLLLQHALSCLFVHVFAFSIKGCRAVWLIVHKLDVP
jgi:hypothetical protein